MLNNRNGLRLIQQSVVASALALAVTSVQAVPIPFEIDTAPVSTEDVHFTIDAVPPDQPGYDQNADQSRICWEISIPWQ